VFASSALRHDIRTQFALRQASFQRWKSVHSSWLGIATLLAAGGAASILITFLVRRPILSLTVKLWLLLGIGVLPSLAAASSTVSGMEATTHREFCGSCHVMTGHYLDSSNPRSQSLAARHSRNPFFGDRSCYVCHADYGMYGYPLTKAGGMRHVYLYYFGGYRQMSDAEADRKIHLMKPYDNTNCRQCHTATTQIWRSVPDHEALRAALDSNRVSCASAGCHGFAHPASKLAASAPAASAPNAIPARTP
jgi:nitrate/TMAO reductase-like tetraheme cytochrome c subunit